MNRYFALVSRFFRKALGFLPSRLPIGMTEFKVWSADIADQYGLPDHVSTQWALATMIVSLPPDKRGWSQFYKSKRYFGVCALKSMSNQIAAGVMEDLKAQQRAAQQAELEAQKALAANSTPAEATAPTEQQAASNVIPIQN